MNRKAALIGAGGLAAALLLVGFYMLGRATVPDVPEGITSDRGTPSQTHTTSPTVNPSIPQPPEAPEGFVYVRDPQATFWIAVPKKWAVYKPGEKDAEQVRLIVSPNGQDSAQVRVVDTPGITFTADTLDQARKITNREFRKLRREGIQILVQGEPLQVAQLPGLLYIYQFEGNKEKGAHARYVIFADQRTFTIIFQAIPSTSFNDLVPTFDKILESFRAIPRTEPVPSPTPTSSPTL